MPRTESKAPRNDNLSPLTGYTRDHWLEIAGRLVAGVMHYVDPATGVPHLVGDPGETALAAQLRNPGGIEEALDRTMLLAALYVGAAGRTTVDGWQGDVVESYLRGSRHFLTGDSAPGYRSPFRAASVLAMLLVPEHFLEPLEPELKRRLAAHLAEFAGGPCRDNNTMLFRMMPAPLLDRLGQRYNRDLLDDYFDTILSMYRGDGWFIDGWNRGFDHYNLWGFQLYLHALAHFDARWHERYAERIREITLAHELTLPFYFGSDGGPVPKGRSLNYRFAVLSGIAFAQLSGLGGMHPGLARRIASGCLRYFGDHGCLSERGLLEPGYHGPNSAVGEDYTDRGAPYWAATGLAALALPADHAFWTAEEQPMPADTPGVKRCPIPGAQMVLKIDGDRGEARMITLGEPFFHRRVWQAGSKYYQHAYSSTLGYALAGDLGPELSAGRTAISRDGRTWSHRTWPRAVSVDAGGGLGEWDAWPGREGLSGSVITRTIVLERGEIHVFHHTAEEPRYLAIGGYAVRVPHGERAMMEAREAGLVVTSGEMWSVMLRLAGPAGRFVMEELHPRPGFKHSHLFGGWAAWPRWVSSQPVPPGTRCVVFVDAARRAETPDVEEPDISAAGQGGRMTIRVGEQSFVV